MGIIKIHFKHCVRKIQLLILSCQDRPAAARHCAGFFNVSGASFTILQYNHKIDDSTTGSMVHETVAAIEEVLKYKHGVVCTMFYI